MGSVDVESAPPPLPRLPCQDRCALRWQEGLSAPLCFPGLSLTPSTGLQTGNGNPAGTGGPLLLWDLSHRGSLKPPQPRRCQRSTEPALTRFPFVTSCGLRCSPSPCTAAGAAQRIPEEAGPEDGGRYTAPTVLWQESHKPHCSLSASEHSCPPIGP